MQMSGTEPVPKAYIQENAVDFTIEIHYFEEFRTILSDLGIESVKLPRSPNLNVYAERFGRTTKESALRNDCFLVKMRCERACLISITAKWPDCVFGYYRKWPDCVFGYYRKWPD